MKKERFPTLDYDGKAIERGTSFGNRPCFTNSLKGDCAKRVLIAIVRATKRGEVFSRDWLAYHGYVHKGTVTRRMNEAKKLKLVKEEGPHKWSVVPAWYDHIQFLHV